MSACYLNKGWAYRAQLGIPGIFMPIIHAVLLGDLDGEVVVPQREQQFMS